MVKYDKLTKAMAGFRRGPGRPRQTRRSGYKRPEGDGMETHLGKMWKQQLRTVSSDVSGWRHCWRSACRLMRQGCATSQGQGQTTHALFTSIQTCYRTIGTSNKVVMERSILPSLGRRIVQTHTHTHTHTLFNGTIRTHPNYTVKHLMNT